MKRFLLALVFGSGILSQQSFAQTQPKVLAELFGNFGCTNCRTPDDNYSVFVAQNPNDGIVVINYHNEFPDVSDHFYVESKAAVTPRESSSFYNVTGDPSAFIDGVPSESTPQFQWINSTNTDLAVPLTPIDVTAGLQSDGLIHVKFNVTGPASGQSKVYVVLKESHVYYANTFSPGGYGNPPDSLWNDIFRVMLPSTTGSDPLAPGENKSFDITYDPTNAQQDWNIQNMTAVVFVQDVKGDPAGGFDVESLGVANLASSGVAASSNAGAASLEVLGTSSRPSLRISLPQSSRVELTLCDLLGREVRTVVD